MGKKHTAGATKQRPGTDITRFLERRTPNEEVGAVTGGRCVVGALPSGGRASTPGKHLLDNVLLSQDADDDGGMQVVWASSPTAAYSPQKGAGGSQETSSASQQQGENSQASKDGFRKTLIQAVQCAPDAEFHVAAQLPQPADDMLEQLLARRSSHRVASTSARMVQSLGRKELEPRHEERLAGPATAPKPRSSAFEGFDADVVPTSDDLFMQELLDSTDTYKTPGPTMRPRPVAATQSADLVRPAMCTPSALTIGGKRPLGASGKMATSGSNKRRALLDLLDQVELMVKHPDTAAPSQIAGLPQRDLRSGLRTLPAGSIKQEQQQPSIPGTATVCSVDAESTPRGARHAALTGSCKPGVAVAGQQTTRPICTGSVPSLLLLGVGSGDASQAVGIGGTEDCQLTAGDCQQQMGTTQCLLPTQPVNGTSPDLVSLTVPDASDATSSDSRTGAAAHVVGEGVTAGRCMSIPLQYPRPVPGPQVPSAAGPITQPLALAAAFTTPFQGAASSVPANHSPHASRSFAANQQPRAAEMPFPAGATACTGAQQAGSHDGVHDASKRLAAVSPTAANDDDDDDDFWRDVDVDALVANATKGQPSPVGAGPANLTAILGAPAGSHAQTHTSTALPHQHLQHACHARPGEQQQQAHAQQAPGRPPLPSAMSALQQQEQQQPDMAKVQACGPPDAIRPPAQNLKDGTSALSASVPLLGQREELHFVVLEVEQSPNGYNKVLRCFNEYKGVEVRVCLRDMWADQEVQPGDTVNVVGGRVLASPSCTTLELSATEGLLILHPDVLLSGTSICTAIRCARQAWLQERVASGPGGERALMGSMLHELLQRSLRAAISGKLDKNVMMAEARSILAANTAMLLESQQDEATVLAYITQQLDGIIAWCNSYVTPNPATPNGGRIELTGRDAGSTFCRVTEVLDIEESIWAPKYGLKGQLDASLRVKLSGAEAPRPSGVQHWSQQEPAHFRGMRGRRASEGCQPGGGILAGGSVTGIISRADHAVPQHPWSASKAAPSAAAVQPGGPPHVHHYLTVKAPDTADVGVIAPFEFKTGKDWHEHRAQVLLYLLLMEDRYQTAVRTGLLWNSNKPTMQAVRYAHHELASLIMHRNRLATYLVGPAREPPPPLQASEADRKCEYCGVSATCALYLAAAAAGTAAHSDVRMAEAVGARLAELDLHRTLRELVSTVSPSSAAFFARWVGLVDLEEHAVRSNRADVWALSGQQREHLGGCVAQLLLERELPPRGDAGEQQQFMYVFRRRPVLGKATGDPGSTMSETSLAGPADVDTGPGGLLCSGFAPGDMALLGVEGRHAAAARVTVVDVTKDTLTLSCRKELKYVKLGDAPRPTCGCCNAGAPRPPGLCCCAACATSRDRVTWRLDREEAASLFAQLRLNLSLLGIAGAGAGWPGGGGAEGRKGGSYDAAKVRREGHLMQLRKLIIDLEPPQQGHGLTSQGANSQLSASVTSSQLCGNDYLREHAHKMNGEQLEAVQRVLMMQDYVILLGMPGSGKTTTIVHIIRALVEKRASILVASYTNSAVDNILLKLIGSPVPFVRLGSAQAVHPAVRPYMPGGERHPNTSVAGLQEMMSRVSVVGCTCLSVHNPLLAGRTFSACILDEASQVTLPASTGALALARSFLLVGDHYQLSPLVVSREAAQGGLGISLFRRLSEAHPQAVVTLRSQYRMAADIMALSNALVYNGRMLCGNEGVAGAMLHLPYASNLASYGSARAQASPRSPWPCERAVPGWLLALLRPECRVVFLDTDCVSGCREVALQDGMVNRGEVHLVHAVASALVSAGLPPRDIGVASPYKVQVATLQQAIAGHGLYSPAEAPSVGAGDGALTRQGFDGSDGRDVVEVLTVDKYQGRDKAAILLSFVRCNASRSAGQLLADWQRLNVAITRARTKLVLVGSAATLASIPMLDDMLTLLRRKGWIRKLPIDCLAELPDVPNTTPALGAATTFTL